MDKIDRAIKSINAIIKADIDKLKEELEGIKALDATVDGIEEYEKKISKLLRNQKKHFTDGINEFVAKDATLKDVINYVKQDLFAADEFAKDMDSMTNEFLNVTMTEMCTIIMDSIDKDVEFEVFSNRTTDWIDSWSKALGELMQVNCHKEMNKLFDEALENGDSIQDIVQSLKDFSGFDRKRAETTAITEILTANSVSTYESYCQSPAVVKKVWFHSGSKNNNPRPDHVALDGTSIELDEYFDVGGEDALYPRDVNLSAKQRVRCHCDLGNEIDEVILKLSKEEKLKLKEEALAEMN
jgi:F like protein